MPGGNKSSHLLKVCMYKVCKVCLTINDLLLPPGIKSVNATNFRTH